ncbi:Altered inheritance of mitochondria protein 6 [Mycena sanguinolenta]|uniref:Altered inheritance of mitochondria protein 6 n=1 Tax=Mycena sanguinolenta TaxID=230812 RepID=A0A8H6XXG9_9AGAR|nr:Altered inheritance of mitochondria protein 6 [Mycena sanguinolenta]
MVLLFALAAFASTTLAVKPIHSHNDYLQAVPFWDAFNLSIMSVEADVWWQDSQLFVAHTSDAIVKTRTLDSLYLENIMGLINGSIPSATPFVLPLLIDMKSDGPTTFQPVWNALQPLRTAGHLTTYANGILTQGAVTVVGTGNTPLASVVALDPRDVFFDSDIRHLYSTLPSVGVTPQWGPEISPLSSVDYSDVSNTAQMQALVLNAHDFKIRSRFWGHRRQHRHVEHLLGGRLGLGERGRSAGRE